MLSTLVQVNAGHGVTADSVLGQHALDGQLHSIVGALLHHEASLGLLQAADPTGNTVVDLLVGLIASEDSLVSVDDDNIVAAVDVRGEIDLVLATQQVSSDDGGTAQGLAGGIQDLLLFLYQFARV